MKTRGRRGYMGIGLRTIQRSVVAGLSLFFLLPLLQAQAIASSSLPWSEPEAIDHSQYPSLTGISCPTTSFCAAVGYFGGLFISTDPAGGAETWGRLEVGLSGLKAISCPSTSFCAVSGEGGVLTSTSPTGGAGAWVATSFGNVDEMEAISCPSPSFCAVVDDFGNVYTSTNPTGGAAAWHDANIRNYIGDVLTGVSCPSASLCVATDYTNVFTSTNPTGGAAAWNTAVDDASSFQEAISCPSISLCAAVDGKGNLITSINPTGGSGAWSEEDVDAANYLSDISCPSTVFCTAVDASGNALGSTDPTGGAGGWTTSHIDGAHKLTGVSCVSATFCAAVDYNGNVLVGTTENVPRHSLTIVKAGTGTGVVTSTSLSINCGPICSHAFADGTSVTLTATPASGSTFTGWSGGGCSGTEICQVAINADTTVTATFTTNEGTGGSPGEEKLPNTVLGSHPPATVKTRTGKAKVKFKFSSSTPGATFKCRLDKAAFKPCTSPKTYKVKSGKHIFEVKAIDATGADATPVVYRFRVVERRR